MEKRETFMQRVQDILRRSGVEDGEKLARELERWMLTDEEATVFGQALDYALESNAIGVPIVDAMPAHLDVFAVKALDGRESRRVIARRGAYFLAT